MKDVLLQLANQAESATGKQAEELKTQITNKVFDSFRSDFESMQSSFLSVSSASQNEWTTFRSLLIHMLPYLGHDDVTTAIKKRITELYDFEKIKATFEGNIALQLRIIEGKKTTKADKEAAQAEHDRLKYLLECHEHTRQGFAGFEAARLRIQLINNTVKAGHGGTVGRRNTPDFKRVEGVGVDSVKACIESAHSLTKYKELIAKLVPEGLKKKAAPKPPKDPKHSEGEADNVTIDGEIVQIPDTALEALEAILKQAEKTLKPASHAGIIKAISELEKQIEIFRQIEKQEAEKAA